MTAKSTLGRKVAEGKALDEPRLGEKMSETQHLKRITELKASCVTAHLAFLNSDHTNCQATDADFLKAKSAYEKALADFHAAIRK